MITKKQLIAMIKDLPDNYEIAIEENKGIKMVSYEMYSPEGKLIPEETRARGPRERNVRGTRR